MSNDQSNEPAEPTPGGTTNSKKKTAPALQDTAPQATENVAKARKKRAAKATVDEAAADFPQAQPDPRPQPDPQPDTAGDTAPVDALHDGAADDAPPALADADMLEAPVAFDDLVSGRFDVEEPHEDSLPSKRVLQPQAEQPKLHKVLAQSGLGSRLEMERLILDGRITVNNQPAHIGQRIQFGDKVKINGRPITLRIAQPPARVLAYHKPVGEVVTHDDPQNRPTVFRKLPYLQQGKWQSVGRLDLNTEGLLLFTSSGELANRLMHPRFGLEREYAVRVLGALSDDEKQRLLDGVALEDGMAQFSSIREEGLGEGANQWYRVTISEGRNREVRRMVESVGHAVSRLIRIRYGAMMLPRGLRRGMWMELGDRDIAALGAASGTPDHVIQGGRDPSPPPVAPKRGRGDRGRTRGPRPNMANPGGNRNVEPPRAAYGANPNAIRRRIASTGTGTGSGDDMQAGGPPSGAGRTSSGYIGADSLSRQRRYDGPGGGARKSNKPPRGGAGAGGRSSGAARGGGRRG